ncbi:MAG: glycerate kinase, partial [Candidatus Binatia bacterium]
MSLGVARSPLRAVFAKAVAAVNPRQLIERLVHVEHKTLIVQEQSQPRKVHRFPFSGRVLLVGAGKGAGPLAEQLEIVLGPDLASGVVVVPCGQTLALQRVQCIEGDHPLPGEGSVRGAQAITALLQKKELGVLVCFCLTGGASSLLVSPVTEISLADKIAVNQLLLACGADIHELNTVRKHLSRLKGGGLARHTFPLTTVSFILSDVIDDDLSTIGSGPTVPDNSTFHDAWAVLQKYALLDRLPPPVHAYLFAGCQGKRPETPKLGDEIFSSVHNFL